MSEEQKGIEELVPPIVTPLFEGIDPLSPQYKFLKYANRFPPEKEANYHLRHKDMEEQRALMERMEAGRKLAEAQPQGEPSPDAIRENEKYTPKAAHELARRREALKRGQI